MESNFVVDLKIIFIMCFFFLRSITCTQKSSQVIRVQLDE